MSRRALLLCVAVLAARLAAAADVAQPIALDCEQEGRLQTFPLPLDANVLQFTAPPTTASWLELQEAGQSVELVGALHALRLQVRAPPRYSWSFVPLEKGQELSVRRFDPSRAQGSIAAILHCSIGTDLQQRIDWFRNASVISVAVRTPTDKDNYPALIDSIQSLQMSAPLPTEGALAKHLLAQAEWINDHNADASDAFAQAHDAWIELGESERASAALVGRVEDANRVGQYSRVLDVIEHAAPPNATSGYFAVRLETSRCLALWYLDRLSDAATCYEGTLAGFERLGELTEYGNTLRTYADLQADRGDPDAAERLATQALPTVRGPNAAVVKGGLEELLGKLALHRGAVADSLNYFDRALADLEAGHAPRRWQANVSLRVATIYEELGAYDEALSYLSSAVQEFTARDAPAPMAQAMLLFSLLEAATGHLDSARLWAYAAEATYAELHLPAEHALAQLQSLELQVRQGSVAGVAEQLRHFETLQSTERVRLALLDAEVSIRAVDLPAARVRLDHLREAPLSLHQRIRLAQLDALYWNAQRDPRHALASLSDTALRVTAVANATGNPVLEQLVLRQVQPLQRAAFQIVLRQPGAIGDSATGASGESIDAVWNWLQLPAARPHSRDASQQRSQTQAQFDRAVAQELLMPSASAKSAAEKSAQRSLLALFAQPAQAARARALPHTSVALAALQSQLGADEAFTAYVDGETIAALLWVTHDNVTLSAAGLPNDVRAASASLRKSVSSPGSSLGEIDAAARHLSQELLRTAPGLEPPQRLEVFVEDALNGAVWSVLPWGDDTQPLIERATVTLATLDILATEQATIAVAPLHVIVASQQQGRGAALPVLEGATVEAQQIQASVADRKVTVADSAAATREATLAALADPGAWVHIAAHGIAQPHRIGYAGVWLEAASADAQPIFLSWLDILDAGVDADIVVLNACDLGDSGEAINGNLSFAAAVSRAGARQVVAALWPISDSASALWVPEFYSALNASAEHDTASSLRAAQLRLRSTSMFRHPYFWAGMQVTERLVVPPASQVSRPAPPTDGAW